MLSVAFEVFLLACVVLSAFINCLWRAFVLYCFAIESLLACHTPRSVEIMHVDVGEKGVLLYSVATVSLVYSVLQGDGQRSVSDAQHVAQPSQWYGSQLSTC